MNDCSRMMRTRIRFAKILPSACRNLRLISAIVLLVFAFNALANANCSHLRQEPTWLQAEIEKQRLRLNSSEVEERRDAVMRLGALHRAEASRAVLATFKDASAIVRVAAANAVSSLPAEESIAFLIPLLNDKDPFVRQEGAYAMGIMNNHGAVAALVERMTIDKDDGVRGAAAVALGKIRDEGAVVPLAQVLSPSSAFAKGARKRKTKENEFVLRAAARALGEVGSRAGVPALIVALSNDLLADDIRREAAQSLGSIADPSALPALRAATLGHDSHLSLIAVEALQRIAASQAKKPS